MSTQEAGTKPTVEAGFDGRTIRQWITAGLDEYSDLDTYAECEAAADAMLKAYAAAVREEGQGARLRRAVAPLTIDCEDCGQVVEIPRTGIATCGCAGVTWSLTSAKQQPQPARRMMATAATGREHEEDTHGGGARCADFMPPCQPVTDTQRMIGACGPECGHTGPHDKRASCSYTMHSCKEA